MRARRQVTEAVAVLHEAGDGAHRELDRLTSLCLREAARNKRKLVEAYVVRTVLEHHAHAA